MKKEGALKIAYYNATCRVFRSAMMMFFVFMMSFTTYTFSYISYGTQNGMESLSKRLGADIAVVPGRYTYLVENALFRGEPCTIYFESEWIQKIKLIEGIEQVTPQLFIATLNGADCCMGQSVQLIGFDPVTDFVVRPWIEENYAGELKDGYVYIGNSIAYEKGDTVTYFGTEFKVTGKLEKTGMGYDKSIFIKMDDAYRLANSKYGKNYLAFSSDGNLISTIVAKTKKNADTADIVKEIEEKYGAYDVAAISTDTFMKTISQSINKFSNISNITIVLNIITSMVALISLFSITINERKKEFGILFSIGADRGLIFRTILCEAFMITGIGTLSGSAFAQIILYFFQTLIHESLDIPYLSISIRQNLKVIGMVSAISLLTGIISAVHSTYRICSAEACELIKEG